LTTGAVAPRERRLQLPIWVRSITGYLIVPNLAFLILGWFVYMNRPLVNLDYLLLGAVAGLLPPAIVIVAYVLLVANDAFVTLAPVFHFNLETAAWSTPYGLRLGLGAASLGFVLVTSAVTIAVLGIRFSQGQSRRGVQPSALALALLIFGLDFVGGTNRLSHADAALIPFNLATSASYNIVLSLYHAVRGGRSDPKVKRIEYAQSATGQLRRVLNTSSPAHSIGAQHLVIVIVESLGQLEDSAGAPLILGPLLSGDVRRRYTINIGTVQTHGATTSGELRELCGVDTDYRSVGAVDVTSCIPIQLRSAGFKTVAIHGYSGGFFDRARWYPQIGFEQAWFGDDLARQASLAVCGSTFRGVRDPDAGRFVARQLLDAPKGERRFVYWLTLSSHLPVDASCGAESGLDCRATAETTRFADVCALLRIQYLVAQSVAEIATDPLLPPTRFIVVGDHPPPFFSRARRSLFAERRVPFVELIPRPARPSVRRATSSPPR